MDDWIKSLADKCDFGEKERTLLDSLAWQEQEKGLEDLVIKEDLQYAVSIANHYFNPAEALNVIDKSMKIYLKRLEHGRAGNFKSLYEKEQKVIKISVPVINGLKTRIEEYLLGISYERQYNIIGGLGGYKEDISPWQENAIRDMEG